VEQRHTPPSQSLMPPPIHAPGPYSPYGAYAAHGPHPSYHSVHGPYGYQAGPAPSVSSPLSIGPASDEAQKQQRTAKVGPWVYHSCRLFFMLLLCP
jgi:hypothetical protein